MASTELISSRGAPKKSRYTFGKALGDYGKVMANTAMSGLGMNLAFDEFEGDWAEKLSGILSPMAGMVRDTGMTAATMGTGIPVGPGMFAMGGPLKPQSMMQAPVNDIPEFTPRTGLLLPKGYSELAPKLKFKERPRPNKVYAEGGLTKFEGPSHAEGGIQVGKDEVEGNETSMPMGEDQDFIFSEQINVPGTKSSFAKKSKSIESKYIRPNDPYEKKSMMAELGKLAKLQEAVKMFDGMQPEYNTFAKGGKKYANGGLDIYPNYLTNSQESRLPLYNREGRKAYYEPLAWARLYPQVIKGNSPRLHELFDGVAVKNAFPAFSNNFGAPETLFGKNTDYMARQWDPYFNSKDGWINEAALPKGDWGQSDIDKTVSKAIEQNKPYVSQRGNRFGNLPVMDSKGIPTKTPTVEPYSNAQRETGKKAVINTLIQNPGSKSYESNFAIPAAGYAAQALTNIPGLLAKPNYQNSPKVKFDDISLAEERNEARRSRNLGYATAQSMGGNDMGQTMNFMAGTTAGLNSAYGQEFNRSLMQEEQANADINMREQMANSQIGMADADINARERDSAQALRMNALSNIGGVAAQAGKHYQASGQEDNYMNIMAQQGAGDYGYNYENRKFLNPKATMYRKKSSDGFEGGGVRRKDPLAGVTIGPQVGQEMGQTQRFGSGEYNWNDLYQRANPVDFREQIAPDDNTYQSFLEGPEIIAGSNTPKYRDSQVDRMADARTLPGYGVMNDRGMMSPTAQNWGQYPERVRADMASASVSDRADYGAIQDFEMAAAEFPAYLAGPGALGAIRRGKQARATVESATGIPKELAKRAPKVVNATKEVAKQGVGKWTNAGIGATEGAAGYAMNQSDNPWIQGIGTATMGAGALRMLPALGYVAGQGFSKANWLKVPKWLKMQMPWLDDAGKVIAGAVTQAPEALALPLLGGAATLYNKKTGKTNEIRKEDKARKIDLNKFRGGGQ